ncbi:tyrosyl-tRNA synthetase [Candidatus Ishikawaella capsulata Mpkobe]|uniref:Tyrosine--tRNA ligase n=2 Tax=Candidatus Ishikawella capsulata TaxID=168169 RepID=C5WD84_9ENTR|nr:tyrosyl-tRNA synthetase [Candidatus Ishikawaella capsulata Mpkobe]
MELLMSRTTLIQTLHERGLIAQVTNEKMLSKILQEKSITVYCGFDPTASSLHLGHLIPLIILKYFQNAGHKPIILIGGATGLIGDPSFKAMERKLNNKENINKWLEKIKIQVKNFLNFDSSENSAITLNNYDWFSKMNVLSFLRDIGKHFSVNQMINKEAVKQRLNRDEQGISFTEFAYNILQSYDFAYLNQSYGVKLQIGGSDQWGNIITGIMLTKRLYKNEVFGLTVPLLTKHDGTKFGKTENESIWLDAKKTSPYKFYQFWINISDKDVYRFLKLFTFLSVQEINSLKIKNAQYVLAEYVTRLVHGNEGLITAQRITIGLFCGDLKKLTKLDLEQLAQDGISNITLQQNADLPQVLVDAHLAPSRSQAHNMINSGAILVNGQKQHNVKYTFCNKDKLFGKFTLICRGKKHHCLVIWK